MCDGEEDRGPRRRGALRLSAGAAQRSKRNRPHSWEFVVGCIWLLRRSVCGADFAATAWVYGRASLQASGAHVQRQTKDPRAQHAVLCVCDRGRHARRRLRTSTHAVASFSQHSQTVAPSHRMRTRGLTSWQRPLLDTQPDTLARPPSHDQPSLPLRTQPGADPQQDSRRRRERVDRHPHNHQQPPSTRTRLMRRLLHPLPSQPHTIPPALTLLTPKRSRAHPTQLCSKLNHHYLLPSPPPPPPSSTDNRELWRAA